MEQTTKNLEYYKRIPYTLRLEPVNDPKEGKYWLAEFVELRGCKTEGKNEGEAITNLHELFDEYIQTHIENKLPIVEPEKIRMATEPIRVKNFMIRRQVMRVQDVKAESVDTLTEAQRILYRSEAPSLAVPE